MAMYPFDQAHYEDLANDLRAILRSVDGQVSRSTAQLLAELVDHNEPGVALEILTAELIAGAMAISSETYGAIMALSVTMSMTSIDLPSLRSQVDA